MLLEKSVEGKFSGKASDWKKKCFLLLSRRVGQGVGGGGRWGGGCVGSGRRASEADERMRGEFVTRADWLRKDAALESSSGWQRLLWGSSPTSWNSTTRCSPHRSRGEVG